MNFHDFPADDKRTVSHTRIRLHPFWRCVCGHVVDAYDVHMRNENHIVLDCPRCEKRLLEIVRELHAVQ
jgi:hypothetical protein